MPASSPSPLQETARALWFGFSTNIASTGWFLPWRSLMRLSAIQASRHSAIGDGGEMSLPLLHLLTGPGLNKLTIASLTCIITVLIKHSAVFSESSRVSTYYITVQKLLPEPFITRSASMVQLCQVSGLLQIAQYSCA